MKFTITQIRNIITKFVYKYFIKPILFKIDPETVHDKTIILGSKIGRHKFLCKIIEHIFYYENEEYLSQTIKGHYFKNPVGLAAGFDKNADLIDVMTSIGFGFIEIGSITAEKCEGNPKPRLWRLPKLKSLVVYYGLKNEGADRIHKKIQLLQFRIPLGISIAKTNCPRTTDTREGILDYEKSYLTFKEIGNYDVINISCPNTYGGEPFTNPTAFYELMSHINEHRQKFNKKLCFIKLSPDIAEENLIKILEISKQFNVDGFICSNLTKDRTNKQILKYANEIPPIGGLSGKVVYDLSNKQIEFIYKHGGRDFIIVGCGGIFSAEDAYKKIRLGASLIQLITGFIYEGPQLISEIKEGLVKLMQRDGFRNIKEVIGIDVK